MGLEASGEIETVVSFFCFFQDEMNSTVLNALKVVDRGSKKTRTETITVVTA